MMDKRYGRGQWRPIHRFVVHQADGKVRMIDDGRHGGQNEASKMVETIREKHRLNMKLTPTQLKAWEGIQERRRAAERVAELEAAEARRALPHCFQLQEDPTGWFEPSRVWAPVGEVGGPISEDDFDSLMKVILERKAKARAEREADEEQKKDTHEKKGE